MALVQQARGSFDCEAGASVGQHSKRGGRKNWAAYVSATVVLGMVAGALTFMMVSTPVRFSGAFFAPPVRFSGATARARPIISQRATSPRATIQATATSPRATIQATATSPSATIQAPEAAEAEKMPAYYCNEEGCWVLDEGMELPEGMTLSPAIGLVPSAAKERPRPEERELPFGEGIFAPVVKGAASVAGRKELNALRAKVIQEHTKVITKFVDTSDSTFGRIVLKRMFEAADKDDNGGLDKQEVYDALYDLGFKFVESKDVDAFFKKADKNEDAVIEFEEFAKQAPKTLRTNLIKLAKSNGHDLGFLA